MPDNNLEQDGLYGRINSLEEEVADLKYTNQKLYKDCVAFAKKLKNIQSSGILDTDVDSLKELNSRYANEIASLKEEVVALTVENQNMRDVSRANSLREKLEGIEDELPEVLEAEASLEAVSEGSPHEEPAAPEETQVAPPSQNEIALEVHPDTTFDDIARENNARRNQAVNLAEPEEAPTLGPAMRNSNQVRDKRQIDARQKAARNAKKKRGKGRRVFRGILKALLTIVLIVAVISVLSALFAHNFPNATIGGLRCYTVRDDAMAPNIQQTDVIVVKKVPIEKLKPSNVVLTTANGSRSFGSVEAIETREGINYIVVADNTGATYDVSEDEYLGKADYRMAGLGDLAKYALTHRINYFAVLASATLLLIALLILFPSKKPRKKDQPKFGRDYNVEDFTI